MIGAVDIGGTKIAVAMVNEQGQVMVRLDTPTQPEHGPDYGLETITHMLYEAAAQTDQRLRGIGIGCTGPIDPLRGILGNIEFLPGWQGMHLTAELKKRFGVSAYIENDADAAALGEYAFGSGQNTSRFIYLTVSTGIGGGMIFDGKLYRGVEGAHPEVGHHVLDLSGPKCFCGANGCWESLASGLAFARRNGWPTARKLCEAALRGDRTALAACEEEGRLLGQGIANLINLFTPDMISLGGGVMQSLDLFIDRIHQTVAQNCHLVPYKKTKIVPAKLGKDVGVVGAAQVWLQRNKNE